MATHLTFIIKASIFAFLSFFSLTLHATPPPLIAAASSTQFALDELTHLFTKKTGLKVKITYGSSGNFTRQLIQGAPFELFIAADEKYINLLKSQSLLVDDGTIYATGRLALFTPYNSGIKGDPQLLNLTDALNKQKIQRFAIANPQHAPYGKAAKEFLINIGLWDKIQPTLVMGENASQAAQYASSGATQGGIIPYAYSNHPTIQKQGTSILLDSALHQPFHARMALIKSSGSIAKAFYLFLQSHEARSIFNQHGFLMPEKSNSIK